MWRKFNLSYVYVNAIIRAFLPRVMCEDGRQQQESVRENRNVKVGIIYYCCGTLGLEQSVEKLKEKFEIFPLISGEMWAKSLIETRALRFAVNSCKASETEQIDIYEQNRLVRLMMSIL